MKASRSLKEAADVMAQSPSALQLRYLQTLNTMAVEKNSTIIFPPADRHAFESCEKIVWTTDRACYL